MIIADLPADRMESKPVALWSGRRPSVQKAEYFNLQAGRDSSVWETCSHGNESSRSTYDPWIFMFWDFICRGLRLVLSVRTVIEPKGCYLRKHFKCSRIEINIHCIFSLFIYKYSCEFVQMCAALSSRGWLSDGRLLLSRTGSASLFIPFTFLPRESFSPPQTHTALPRTSQTALELSEIKRLVTSGSVWRHHCGCVSEN